MSDSPFDIEEYRTFHSIRPLYKEELRAWQVYRIEGHWRGNFTGLLKVIENKWSRLEVINVSSGDLAVGEEVEIAFGHAQFYAI